MHESKSSWPFGVRATLARKNLSWKNTGKRGGKTSKQQCRTSRQYFFNAEKLSHANRCIAQTVQRILSKRQIRHVWAASTEDDGRMVGQLAEIRTFQGMLDHKNPKCESCTGHCYSLYRGGKKERMREMFVCQDCGIIYLLPTKKKCKFTEGDAWWQLLQKVLQRYFVQCVVT